MKPTDFAADYERCIIMYGELLKDLMASYWGQIYDFLDRPSKSGCWCV